MADRKPKISFIFPYRWFTDDKEFLGVNLVNKIEGTVGKENLQELKFVVPYAITVNYYAYKPVDVPLTEKSIQKLLKPIFPNGKCMNFESFFMQARSKTVLPVIDFQIYF